MSGRAWLLSAAALLLLLAVASLGVAVTFLDPNDYKPQIIAAVQQATGRTLSLGGPLRISRSLWPTINVSRWPYGFYYPRVLSSFCRWLNYAVGACPYF